MADFESILDYAKDQFKFKHNLKDKQIETLRNLYLGKDVISVLPTGYGKSVIYQLLPWIFQRKHYQETPMIVLVVSPLTALMEDQVMDLRAKGFNACFLNIHGSSGITYTARDDDSEEEDAREDTVHYTEGVGLDAIERGDFNLLYIHPEALHNKKLFSIFRSLDYVERVCCVVVDEVHMVAEWGEKFRPSFKRLGELTCLYDSCPHLALTATLTPSSVIELGKELQYKDPAVVKLNSDRPNIFINVKSRLPNIIKAEKYDQLIVPIAEELKQSLKQFPLTIVYVESLEALGYYYQYLNYALKELQYYPHTDQRPENRLFAQYHTEYTQLMKSHIIQELKKDDPTLRLVLATVALGMGLNAPHIRRIIHCRPPTTLEKYAQEIGRAGRDGARAQAILYFNNNDIAQNRKGLSKAIVEFCKNKETCLRLQLVRYFGFQEVIYDGAKEECCCNCAKMGLNADC